jgi:hypothetical protein
MDCNMTILAAVSTSKHKNTKALGIRSPGQASIDLFMANSSRALLPRGTGLDHGIVANDSRCVLDADLCKD